MSALTYCQQVSTNADGDQVLTLITSDMEFDREISFETEATSGDSSLWTGTASFTISGVTGMSEIAVVFSNYSN